MKAVRYLSKIFKASLFTICLLGATNAAYAHNWGGSVYAQLSSSHTQLAGSNQIVAALENVDSISDLQLENCRSIVVNTPGLYFIGVTGQVGTNRLALKGSVDLWLFRNGKHIPHSHVSQAIDGPAISNVGLQSVLYLQKGDSISIGVSASTPTAGLIARIGTSPDQNIIPSIAVTMYKFISTQN